ncbi:hypothetical protein GWK47_015711 [Chionoecetes opilio]|uniref:Retrotransposon gag domain-containing protein n=1 Tax=Chionoecetes opilio TaxID=41210 RepID=A0A8J4XTX6_CHIOP|nr:hypothetical protein GWK47_015711 [Chionoecetes opilio]
MQWENGWRSWSWCAGCEGLLSYTPSYLFDSLQAHSPSTQQLNSADKNDFSKIKAALISAFAADKFVAYEQFVTRRLQDGESVDVYLADLRRLAALFGGIPDNGLICAFVAGLPSSVSHILRAGSRLEDLDITQVLSRARAVLVEGVAGAGTTNPWMALGDRTGQLRRRLVWCVMCVTNRITTPVTVWPGAAGAVEAAATCVVSAVGSSATLLHRARETARER